MGIGAKFPQFNSSDPVVERGLNSMARELERLSQFPNVGNANVFANGAGVFIDPIQFDPSIPFYNADSANSIPAFGCALLNGINTDSGTPMMKTKQPDTYGCQSNWLLNGPTIIPASSFGYGQAIFGYGPCGEVGFKAAYNTGDGTPTLNARWGPRSGSYLLRKNTGGFFVVGIFDSSAGIALVAPEPMITVRGTIASDLAPDANGTLTIYTGAFGSEATTSQTISNVYNKSDCTLKSGSTRFHTAIICPDNNGWQFVVGRTA